MATVEQVLASLSKLRVDRARGDPAPHKPLLLLAVLDLAESAGPLGDVLPLSPELAFRFFTFWGVVSHRRHQRPEIKLPFFHLKSDGVWSPRDATGNIADSKLTAQYALLTASFKSICNDPAYREQARRILIASN